MRYFTEEVAGAEEAGVWADAKTRYWKHVEEIRHRLPQSLLHLHLQYSFHDGVIESAKAIHDGEDLLLVINGCRNGHVGDTDPMLFVLHFIGVTSQENAGAIVPNAEILYVEVDVTDDGVAEFSILMSEGETWSIRFRDFGCYLHDYMKEA